MPPQCLTSSAVLESSSTGVCLNVLSCKVGAQMTVPSSLSYWAVERSAHSKSSWNIIHAQGKLLYGDFRYCFCQWWWRPSIPCQPTSICPSPSCQPSFSSIQSKQMMSLLFEQHCAFCKYFHIHDLIWPSVGVETLCAYENENNSPPNNKQT